ncbi:hypothetical protein DICPUDRAFT_156962 [Dictyostelium purpureum]|uniref:Carbohydrate binding domain-containing protein n=1 Tax=Dictyostelium purpureum TaxID=5786 RepID=F0ZXW7_DICPU|nr:uncharacterized protein DICPUDRAFT_156962 [Dictyostelium purpureum]EGC31206.1 hypothetical protein DICPUDRAFT_156962 [Dictyostelium purpureum]|eukprot:XP_003292266.1 hypothetical protein DICPUDRAFT_156962 [Dictyostelium purpureum]
MKFLTLIFLILFFYCAAANHYGCNNVPCGPGRICLKLRGVCSCIEIPKCKEVILTTKCIGTWQFEGKTYNQYDVTITNYLDFDITQIFIGIDESFKLHADNLWNAERCGNGNELTLPHYQPSINKNASFTFGFILCGNDKPNLSILAVTY